MKSMLIGAAALLAVTSAALADEPVTYTGGGVTVTAVGKGLPGPGRQTLEVDSIGGLTAAGNAAGGVNGFYTDGDQTYHVQSNPGGVSVSPINNNAGHSVQTPGVVNNH